MNPHVVVGISGASGAAIAHCLADNLLGRAADVHLKERRPLVLVARETPLHPGHLCARMAASEAGAIVTPPAPAFYLKPASVAEIIAQIARRAIDLLPLFGPMAARWHGAHERPHDNEGVKASTPTTRQIIGMDCGK